MNLWNVESEDTESIEIEDSAQYIDWLAESDSDEYDYIDWEGWKQNKIKKGGRVSLPLFCIPHAHSLRGPPAASGTSTASGTTKAENLILGLIHALIPCLIPSLIPWLIRGLIPALISIPYKFFLF